MPPSTETSTELARQDEQTNGAVATAPDETSLSTFYAGTDAIGPEDLALPRLMLGQPTSVAVQEQIVPAGSLFVAHEAADPAPTIIYKPGQKTGAVIHAIGFRKVWCHRSDDDKFIVADRLPTDTIGPGEDAQPGYEMAVLVPAFDTGMPVSWLLKSTGMSAGKRIYTETIKQGVALWSLAWSVTTSPRQNDKGRWFAPVAKLDKPKPVNVKAAAQAAQLLGAPSSE
jgi:hypothetical protein